MLVKEAMSRNVITIDRNKTVLDASNKYRDYKVGCLVVTDKGNCVGIITERDIIERTICLHKIPEQTKVGDVMCSNVKTIHSLETLGSELQPRLRKGASTELS